MRYFEVAESENDIRFDESARLREIIHSFAAKRTINELFHVKSQACNVTLYECGYNRSDDVNVLLIETKSNLYAY